MNGVKINPRRILLWLAIVALVQLIIYLVVTHIKPDNIPHQEHYSYLEHWGWK